MPSAKWASVTAFIVDTTNGNDENAGTTSATALKTQAEADRRTGEVETTPTKRSFKDSLFDLAVSLMPDAGFDRVKGSGFTDLWEVALSSSSPPVADWTLTDGWAKFSATTGTSLLALSPITPGASTYAPIFANYACRAAPWAMGGQYLINASAFTSGTSIVFMSLDGSGVGGSGSNRCIQIVSNGSTSRTQTYIRLQNGSSAVDVSTGPDGVLGGIGGIPINQPFKLLLYFNQKELRWAINERYNASNVLTFLAFDADQYPETATAVTSFGNDTTIGNNYAIGDLAIVYCSAQENK